MTHKKYSVVIILANWMDADGKLNDETTTRVEKGCHLYLKGKADRILLMGWDYRDDTSLCISDAMNDYIQKHFDIEPDRILIDRKSRDTVGDAVFSKREFCSGLDNRAICVVTSDYHQRRVKDIFDFIYGEGWHVDVIGVHTGRARQMMDQEKASLEAFRATFATVVAGDDKMIFKTMAERHPYYNGEVYPKIELH